MRITAAILLSCGLASGADYWITNTASWPGGITGGDTLHLVGTFTNTLQIGGSGTAGNPITILFEAEAKFSKPAWGDVWVNSGSQDTGANDPIYYPEASARLHDIVIDGGVNGTITSTSNGAFQTETNGCYAINLKSVGANVEIKNLIITNMYARVTGQEVDAGFGHGIYLFGNPTNLLVHNLTINNVGNGIQAFWYNGYATNVQIYSNTITDISVGIQVGAQGNNSTIEGVQVWANRLNYFNRYSGNPANHQDGIMLYCTLSGQTNRGARIYRNYVGPVISTNQTTSAVFINDTTQTGVFEDIRVFNNLFTINTGDSWANGIVSGLGNPLLVMNNTYIGIGASPVGIALAASDYGKASFQNNLCYNIAAIIQQALDAPAGLQPTLVTNSDFNIGFAPVCDVVNWWMPGSFRWGTGTSYRDHATFPQFANFDNNSSTNQPTLTADYVPATNDTVLTGTGTNLSAYFTTDFYGVTRTNWDIGAFNSGSTNAPPPAAQPPIAPTFSPTAASGPTMPVEVTISVNVTNTLVYRTNSSAWYDGSPTIILWMAHSDTVNAYATNVGTSTGSAVASQTYTTASPPPAGAGAGRWRVERLRVLR